MSVVNVNAFLPTKKQLAFLISFKGKPYLSFRQQCTFTNYKSYKQAVDFWCGKGILAYDGSTVVLVVKWFPNFIYNWFVKE